MVYEVNDHGLIFDKINLYYRDKVKKEKTTIEREKPHVFNFCL